MLSHQILLAVLGLAFSDVGATELFFCNFAPLASEQFLDGLVQRKLFCRVASILFDALFLPSLEDVNVSILGV